MTFNKYTILIAEILKNFTYKLFTLTKIHRKSLKLKFSSILKTSSTSYYMNKSSFLYQIFQKYSKIYTSLISKDFNACKYVFLIKRNNHKHTYRMYTKKYNT